MKCSEEYLGVKKIVVIEEIAKIISENKDCLDVDLGKLVNTQANAIIEEIGIVLKNKKADEQKVKEIRNIFDKYKISH